MKLLYRVILIVVGCWTFTWLSRTLYLTSDLLMQAVKTVDYPHNKSDVVELFLTYGILCVLGMFTAGVSVVFNTYQILKNYKIVKKHANASTLY